MGVLPDLLQNEKKKWDGVSGNIPTITFLYVIWGRGVEKQGVKQCPGYCQGASEGTFCTRQREHTLPPEDLSGSHPHGIQPTPALSRHLSLP